MEERRARILEAATRCFARRGFHQTKTVEIAREAGVGEGTLYNHFKDKSDLFLCVVERIKGALEESRLRGIADIESAHERFLKMSGNLEEYFLANPPHAEILTRELRERDASQLCDMFFETHYAISSQIVADLAEETNVTLSPEQVEALAISLMGGFDLILNRWCLGGHLDMKEPGILQFSRAFVSIFEGWGKAGEKQ